MVFVTGLMVAMGGEVGVLGNAPGFIVTLELHAFVDGEGRNADARETEVVGAVVMSCFGTGVGTKLKAKVLRGSLNCGIERGALGARDLDFLGGAERHDVIEVKVEGNFAGGDWRMFAQVFRSEQTLLFASHSGKEDGATGLQCGLRIDTRYFQNNSAAGGVVHGAVENVVSRHVGSNAEVI